MENIKKAIPVLALVMCMLSGAAVTKDAAPVPDGIYMIASAINEKYVWEVRQPSTEDDAEEDASLKLYERNGSDSQKFHFIYNTDGYYTIVSVESKYALDCAQGVSENGINVNQYVLTNSDYQRWKLVSDGNGYFILKSKSNGNAADVPDAIVEDGVGIQVFSYNNSMAQKFKLIKTEAGKTDAGDKAVSVKRTYVLFYKAIALAVILAAIAIIAAGSRRYKEQTQSTKRR